ncbi:Hypothetical protein Minf_2328 [Methylacidiphilum infernorum V4]|uniref:Uncharacterized protein n=1 Tax=Methylacidiphilum infernorum (isolate V4) TaxID=481448 RepID=B3E0F3_METI4|nr:Hypothetical protein Minf_2328 [Methylacidiphilum infernorum V4]
MTEPLCTGREKGDSISFLIDKLPLLDKSSLPKGQLQLPLEGPYQDQGS